MFLAPNCEDYQAFNDGMVADSYREFKPPTTTKPPPTLGPNQRKLIRCPMCDGGSPEAIERVCQRMY